VSRALGRKTVMRSPYQVSAYFSHELESFKDFLKFSERHWQEESASYEESLNIEEHEALSWDRYRYRNDLAANINQVFPQYQRQSQLIMIVSLFEDYLNQLCMSFEQTINLKVAVTDFRGSGIERAKTYLTKAVGIAFPSDSISWQRIVEAQSIRNIVAHNAGHLDKIRHSKHLRIVNASKGLDAEEFARVHLVMEIEYLTSVVDAMNDLVRTLQNESASA